MADSRQEPAATQTSTPLELTPSRQFVSWLAETGIGLAFTTYQAGKLFLIGTQDGERLSVFERTFSRCMGLCGDAQTLYLSTLYQLWRLENSLGPGEEHEGYDRLYVPRVAWTTGDIDVHDLAVDASGGLVFVNTLFGCIATVSDRHSFVPLWKPPFLSKLAAEDRCHLNGLALRDGAPRYVTSVSTSDASDGWREQRASGGAVTDVRENAVVVPGLSMPHSPRWHRDRLWLLDSGSGFFGAADLERGRFERVTFCPGYPRGLALVNNHAIVGLSRPRHEKTFAGLPLQDELARRRTDARCGLQVIDLATGDAVHWLRISGVVEELYDVVVLPGVRRPMALGFRTDEIRRVISVGPWGDAGPVRGAQGKVR